MNLEIEQIDNHAIRITYEDGQVFEGYDTEGLNNLLLEHNIALEEFAEVFGMNTGLLIETPELVSVMFREDVERYLRQIIENTPTYFD